MYRVSIKKTHHGFWPITFDLYQLETISGAQLKEKGSMLAQLNFQII